jgi:hypothetical protein
MRQTLRARVLRLCLVLALPILPACTSARGDAPDAFVRELRTLGVPRATSNSALVRHGREICTVLGRGESAAALAEALHYARVWVDGTPMPDIAAASAAGVVAAAKEHLCPRVGRLRSGTKV